jgi:hypothetical protein
MSTSRVTARTLRRRQLRDFYKQMQAHARRAHSEFIQIAYERCADLQMNGPADAFAQRLEDMWRRGGAA